VEVLQKYWMVLFLLAAGHGLFLAVLLLRASSTQKHLKYLAALVLLFSLSLIYYVGFWTGITPTISPLWGLILTLPTLFGPLIYAYAQSLEGKSINWLYHGLPFAGHFLYGLVYQLQLGADLGWSGFSSTGLGVGILIQNVSLIIYSILLIRHPATKKVPSFRWVSGSFFGYSCSLVLYYLLVNTIDFKPQHDYFISLFMSAFMFTVGYLSLRPYREIKSKARPPRLSPSLSAAYQKQLLTYMQTHKPYLQGDLKIKDVAEALGMSVHHLSEVINTEMEVNFAEFINKYRIEEAVNLLDSDHGIMEIGYRVGFNNKTSFSQTFKKITGFTPSQFRSNHTGQLVKQNVR